MPIGPIDADLPPDDKPPVELPPLTEAQQLVADANAAFEAHWAIVVADLANDVLEPSVLPDQEGVLKWTYSNSLVEMAWRGWLARARLPVDARVG